MMKKAMKFDTQLFADKTNDTATNENTYFLEFKDLPDTTTPLSSANLNQVQELIKNYIDTQVATLNNTITTTDNARKEYVDQLFNSITNGDEVYY